MTGGGVDDCLSRPIILVGCGRSGSTLFSRVLDAHPGVRFLAETDFVVARVWHEVWDNRFWLNFEHHMNRAPTSIRAAPVEIAETELAAAKERAARGVRLLFAELMQVDQRYAAWGYKEIWNGNPAVATVPWSVYHAVFPQARWVHLVRDPFGFVRSSARWNEVPLSFKLLRNELHRWNEVVAWSRQLAQTNRFHEIYFEDLRRDPKATLLPILGTAGLDWHPACDAALSRRVMASPDASPYRTERRMERDEIAALVQSIEGLAPLIAELGYQLPESIELQKRSLAIESSLPAPVDLRSMERIVNAVDAAGRAKDAAFGRVVRKAVTRTISRLTRSGLRNKVH